MPRHSSSPCEWSRPDSPTSHSSQRDGDTDKMEDEQPSSFKDVPWKLATFFLPICHLPKFNHRGTLSSKGDWDKLPSHISCKTPAWESLLLNERRKWMLGTIASLCLKSPVTHHLCPLNHTCNIPTPSPRRQPKESSSYCTQLSVKDFWVSSSLFHQSWRCLDLGTLPPAGMLFSDTFPIFTVQQWSQTGAAIKSNHLGKGWVGERIVSVSKNNEILLGRNCDKSLPQPMKEIPWSYRH